MAQIKEEILEDVMKSLGIPVDHITKVISMAKEKQNAQRPERTVARKKPFLVVIDDPEGEIKKPHLCYVIQKEEAIKDETGGELTEPHEWGDMEVEARLASILIDMRVKEDAILTMEDLMASAPRKVTKPYGISIKTKEPVALVPVNVLADDIACANPV